MNAADVLLDDDGNRITFCRGILALCGDKVDQTAFAGLGNVDPTWQQKRQQRDGDHFHVTFLTKPDLQMLADNLRSDCSETEEALQAAGVPMPDPDDTAALARAAIALLATRGPSRLMWLDVGAGRAKDDNGEAAFRVLLWPAAAAVRRMLGLAPQDFHISLGFQKQDVHGKSKGLSSLVAGAPDAAAVPQLLAQATLLLDDASAGKSHVEGVEQLAEAALRGADAQGDQEAEAGALRVLCALLLVRGGKQADEVLPCAERLLELQPQDELGTRSRALALVMLSRFEEALPALELAQSQLHKLPAEKRAAEETRLKQALVFCQKKLGAGKRLAASAATVK
jgi:hypothetical protein